MKKKNSRLGEKRNVWKIVSLVFIVLFIMVIAVGAISLRARPQFEEPNESQTGSARDMVAADLLANGDSIDNYEVFVTNRMIGFAGKRPMMNGHMGGMMNGFEDDMMDYNHIQVSLRGESTSYLYVIDADSGKIDMKSFTEWFDE